MKNVTLKQLRAFVVLAQELNFSKAAARLHITAPTLTASIKGLESSLRIQLFDRSTRSVKLTRQSIHFLSTAERLLEDMDRAISDMTEQVNLQAGSVSVTGAASFLSYVVTPAIKSLAVTHPAIRVRLTESGTSKVLSDVMNGQADFGITTLWGKEPVLNATKLLSDRLGVVCHRKHLFGQRTKPININELEGNTFISLSTENGLRQVLDHELRLPDICKKTAYEVSATHLLKPLIKQDVGIALLPALASKAIIDEEIVYVPLQLSVWRHVHFVTHRGRSLSPAATFLKNLIFNQLDQFLGDQTIRINPIS